MKLDYYVERILPSLVIGITLGVSISNQIFDLATPLLFVLLGSMGFIVISFSITLFLMNKVILPSLSEYSLNARVLYILVCLISGFYLYLTIPVNVYPVKLVIIANGEKNSESKGSEVWLNQITTSNVAIPLQNLKCRGEFKPMEGVLVSFAEWQPSKLTCAFNSDRGVLVQLGMHPWSGKVKLIFGQQEIERDLYSENDGIATIKLSLSLTGFKKLIRLLLSITASFSLSFFLLSLLFGSKKLSVYRTQLGENKRLGWYWYSAVVVLFWLIYLLTYWPGFMSPDTVNQYKQITIGQYSNWHPAFHTFFLWLSTRIWFSPAPAIIIQILTLGGLVGWGLAMLEQKGVPRWVNWTIALFLAFSPALGLTLLNPWKDVAFGIALTAMSLMIFYLFESVKAGKSVKLSFWFILAIVSVLVALFRHNGFPVAFGTLILLFLFDKQHRRLIVFVIVASLVIWLGITGPLYRMCNVNVNPEKKGQNLVAYSSALYLVEFHESSGISLSPDQRMIMSQIYQEDGTLSLEGLGQNRTKILRIAMALSFRNPHLTVRYFLDRFSFIFQVLQPPGVRTDFVQKEIYPNISQIRPDPKLLALQPYINSITYFSESPEWNWLFWRNAFWMYLIIFTCVRAIFHLKERRYFIVIIPVLLNAIPLAFVVGGHISRYIFPTLILGPLLGIGLLFVQPASPPIEQTTAERLKSLAIDEVGN